MINRAHRFHRRNAIRYVYRKAKSVRVGQAALKALPAKRDSYRAAVVVSRKVHKSAVVRNRIRRRIYEALRTMEPGMVKPHDLIFVVYSEDFAVMDYSELQKNVELLLKKADVIS